MMGHRLTRPVATTQVQVPWVRRQGGGMKKKAIVTAIVAAMFGWQSIAEAASISTRVRILESKVQKHAQLLEQHKKQRSQYQQQMQKNLQEMRALKKEVEAKLDPPESEKPSVHAKRSPLRYAYP